MNRREFLGACGIPAVCEVNWHRLAMMASAGNVAFSQNQMYALPNGEIRGNGEWCIKKAGDSVTIEMFGEKFYCEVCYANFSEAVDYVRAMALRKEPSPKMDKFAEMFGFNCNTKGKK